MINLTAGDSRDLRIVLLGVSGAGKSSMGNAILGREAFTESRTRESEKQTGRVEDRNISIIDTPGFFNTHLTDEELQNEMMRSMYLCYPGPHVFLLIINMETFREEQRNIVEQIQENLGAQALKFTMVLFVGKEKIPNRKWKLLMESRNFQDLVSPCGGQYHVINSKSDIIPSHITKLLKTINEIIKQSHGQHYDIHMCLRVPIKSRKENIQQEKETKGQETKQEQIQIALEMIHIHSVKEKSRTNVLTEKTDFSSHVTTIERTRDPQENKNNEEVVKQLAQSQRNFFEQNEETNTVQKPNKCWKASGTRKWDQKNQQTEIEDQTQAGEKCFTALFPNTMTHF